MKKNADGADRGETLFEVLKSLPRGSFQSFIMSSSRCKEGKGGETYLPRTRVERAFAAFVRVRPFVPLFMPEWGNEIIKLEAAATPCVIRDRRATRTNVPDVRTQLIITWFEVFAILDSIRISVLCHLNSNPGEQWGNVRCEPCLRGYSSSTRDLRCCYCLSGLPLSPFGLGRHLSFVVSFSLFLFFLRR